MTNVRKEWEALRNQWSHCLFLYHGPGYYYVDTSLNEREKVRQLIEEVQRLGNEARGPEDFTRASDAVSRSVNLMRAEAASVRSVVRFLTYTGELLLNGRLSPVDASSILGPDIAAQGRAVRWMVGSIPLHPEGLHGPEAGLSEWVMMAVRPPPVRWTSVPANVTNIVTITVEM
jgi:hypothetical protein